jgi:ATP-binding cassette, subfamily C, bacterial LapB
MRSIALVQARASAITDLPLNPPAAEEGPPITGRIELIDVTLPPRPGGSGSFLRSLNLVMEPGEIVGIAGPARSGKTAVLSLIDGMLEPQSGRVLIVGLDVTSPQIRAQRRRIQRISGRIAIFRGTILENVAMFRSGVHIGEAVAAMETIGLDAQINKLPEGYDTPIGDGAQIVLPHGFQQALMIARALAQRPAILLVAEVGALLDIDNYRRLERALRRMPNRPTTILASQRGSVFAVADRVFEIREGVLHALGEIAAPEATADEGDASPASASLGGVKQA